MLVDNPLMVVGALIDRELELEPLVVDPPVPEIANMPDWARIEVWPLVLTWTRLTWKPLPVGQVPEGYVTEAELTMLADPVDWAEVSVTGLAPPCG